MLKIHHAIAGSCLAIAFMLAHAEAPMAKSQAPGWYRMSLGSFEITALSDGTVALPVDKLLTHSTPDRIKSLLARSYLKAPVETSDLAQSRLLRTMQALTRLRKANLDIRMKLWRNRPLGYNHSSYLYGRGKE